MSDNSAEQTPTRIDSELSTADHIDAPPIIDDGVAKPKVYPPLSFPVLVLLIPASMLGVLARLGLVAMTTYDGQSIFPLAYAQATGCLIMGFALRLKGPIGQFYSPFYTALTTGFCGSLTTFAGWQLEIFNSWLNAGHFNRSGFHNFIDGLGQTVFTLSLSLASIAFGSSIASRLAPFLPLPRFPSKPVRYAWSAVAVCMYAAAFPAYFKMSPRFRGEATGALLFAYPGALTRYILSATLNPRIQALPLGTLLANSLGTALLGVFYVLQNLTHPVPANTCSLLPGLIDGYCGCLTTVSTFAAELGDLPWRKATAYGVISWAIGQIVLVVTVGAAVWGGHAGRESTCN